MKDINYAGCQGNRKLFFTSKQGQEWTFLFSLGVSQEAVKLNPWALAQVGPAYLVDLLYRHSGGDSGEATLQTQTLPIHIAPGNVFFSTEQNMVFEGQLKWVLL